MFSKFKNKQQQHQQQCNQITPAPHAQSPNPQNTSIISQQTPSKESMFKGTLKVKTQSQYQPQQQSQQNETNLHLQQQTAPPISSDDGSPHKEINHLVEFPVDQNNIEFNAETQSDLIPSKQKTSGFNFLSKTKHKVSQSTDESMQDQNESFIAYGINSQQNSTQIYPQDQICFTFQTQDIKHQYANETNKKEATHTQNNIDHSIDQQQKEKITFNLQHSQNEIQNLNSNLQNQVVESQHKQFQTLQMQLDCFQQQQNQKLVEIFLNQQKIESLISASYQSLQEMQNRLIKLSVEQSELNESEQLQNSLQVEQVEIQNKIHNIEEEIRIQELQFENLQNLKVQLKQDEQNYYLLIAQQLDKIEELHIKFTDQQQKDKISTIKQLQQLVHEENERIKIQKIHLDIDQKHIDEEEQHLNLIMDNQTKEYRISYEKLLQQKQNLDSEIKQLQLMLNQKKQDLQQIDTDLISTKDLIKQVQKKFHQQLDKVLDKRTKIKDELKGLELECIQTINLEQECISRQQDYESKLQSLQDLLIIIKEKKSHIQQSTYEIQAQCQQEMDVFLKYQSSKKISQDAQEKLQQVQRQIDRLNYQRSISQQFLHDILNKKSELQIKLPKMIDSKAQFVQSKNFKGAAQINEQIKEIQNQIIIYENNISQNQSKESQLIQSINEIEDIILLKQQEFKQINQITEIFRYQFQEFKLKQIVQISNNQINHLIQEIKDELNLLFNKYQSILNQTSVQSQDYLQLNSNSLIRNCEKNQLNQFDQDLIHNQYQDNHYPEIQQEIKQLKEKAFQYAQDDQFQEADKIQQLINFYQREASKSIDYVNKGLEIALKERLFK